MLRINQIIKILSDIRPYAPHTYKSKTEKVIDKIHGRLVMVGLVFMSALVLLVIFYKLTNLFKTDFIIYAIFFMYFITTLTGVIIMILPHFVAIKYLAYWKREAFNDFVCEISHDEENARLLLAYSEKELLYAIHWLQMKVNRIIIRVSNFFGEKTAVLSILGLCYSAVQSSIGFNKLSKIFTSGYFSSDTTNVFIMFGLALLLGISLGALMLKKVANHQLYLKEIVELAIRIKKDTENDEGISA
ncbi:hypothetical protein [Pectobacterium aroidearum]|uniref:hypothetical protein n=1 Tax=Pectobacterium aroidearum TaxID=1201031 RepID=UPI0032EC4612